MRCFKELFGINLEKNLKIHFFAKNLLMNFGEDGYYELGKGHVYQYRHQVFYEK